jgi:hypothetical protein
VQDREEQLFDGIAPGTNKNKPNKATKLGNESTNIRRPRIDFDRRAPGT